MRLLFCLFADDTGIFQPAQSFRVWVEERTAQDGSDLGPQLAQLFQLLNTVETQRSARLDERVSEEFGHYVARIPLKAAPHIVHGNALRLDWAEVLPPERCSFVLGNPPFVGAKFMNDLQRQDAEPVFAPLASGGLLDLVAAWYVKAVSYCAASTGTRPRCAFVSTHSITQGEQVGVLWGWLLRQGTHIHLEHRTLQLRAPPEAMKRMSAVQKYRLASTSAPTRKLAQRPASSPFHQKHYEMKSTDFFARLGADPQSHCQCGQGMQRRMAEKDAISCSGFGETDY